MAPSRSTTVASVGLSALVSGGTGAVLTIGNPLRPDAPILTAASTLGVLGAVVILHAHYLPTNSRLRFSTLSLLITLPLTILAIATLANDDIAQFLTRSSALGWVLAATLPLVITRVAHHVRDCTASIDLAYGGVIGVACATLLHLGTSSDVAFSPVWALVGYIVGAVMIRGMSMMQPQPVLRTSPGIARRTSPLAAAFFMAVLTAWPAAPRHELATSAGGQVLAVTLAGFLLMSSFVLWLAEANPAQEDSWLGLRSALGRFSPTIAVASLLSIGGLQAASYSAVTIDDLGRFMVTAEALITRGEFPLWGSYWFLPGLPVLLALSFSVLGYTYPAALAPMFLANTLLPWLIYRGSLAVGAGNVSSFALAVLAVILPPIQIYSLGSAEPDPVFIALLAATVWAFIHAINAPHPSYSLITFSVLAAIMTATRPEGLLYGCLLVMVALLAIRSRRAVVGSITFGVLLLPLVIYSALQLGRFWPTPGEQYSGTALVHKAGVIGDVTLPRLARLLLLNDVRFLLIIAAILSLFSIGSVYASRRHWALAALPFAAILNILITLSIVDSSTTEIRVTLVEDFVRHRAYPLPIVAVLAAVGVTAVGLAARRIRLLQVSLGVLAVATTVYLAAGSLYVLGKPEGFHHGQGVGSLLPSDVHVNAPELWLHPFPLPSGDGNFMGIRSSLVAWYKPFDIHGNTTGMAYQTLTGAFAALGFATLLAAAPVQGSGEGSRNFERRRRGRRHAR